MQAKGVAYATVINHVEFLRTQTYGVDYEDIAYALAYNYDLTH